ncbi:MAG TPA: DUF4011 domain-containing protein, partial [Bacteroidia bacterium]|nr:DUF4011 domain-containing protein [Bacteroidia bacterium]
MKDGLTVSVDFDADATVNYALQQSRTPAVRRLRIVNTGKVAIPDLKVQIVSQPSFGRTIVLDGGLLMPGDERSWERMRLDLDPDWLGKVTESLVGRFLIEVRSGEEVIHEAIREVEVLAPDHWNGLRSLPELIAAFVQPNSRAVESLLVSAAERLAERGGVLNGYQSKSRNAVASQVQALFAAIQARGVHYSNPPASFESSGQKVRLPQRILDSGIATCLDTTLLLCACAEQAGLNSLVVLLDGHAACGIWLEESKFSDIVQDSHSHLKNRVDLEMILMVETTLLCSPGANFAAAVESGRRLLSDEGSFRCVIDIASCRAAEVKPLPFLDDGAIDLEAVARRRERAEAMVRDDGGVEVDEGLDLTELGDRKHDDKGGKRLERWKRNLLDLTLRNRLLSFRHTRATLPLLVPDLPAFEDALAAGESFSLLPLEGAGGGEPRLHEAHEWKDEELGRIRDGFARKSLHAPMAEGALFKSLTELYLAAKASLEENGANTLYLALGFLRWRRGGDSDKAIEAPLILVPLTIERKSVKEGFRIRRGEDEPAFNTTLIEALTVEFGLKIPGVDPLPEDEKGIDVPKVLKLVRHAIADYKGWTVVEAAAVGIFSFSKFLMWKDLEKHSEELVRNPLVAHLILNDGSAPEFAGADGMVRAEELDSRYSPADTLAPLSSDSTQLAAVHSGAEGRTFVLEGPPGTGKSQTITNLIAQALGKRKTVLFVAEKRAALEVVHRRLKQIGLGEFVLELHSNKANKVGVLQQFAEALRAAGDLDRGKWESVCSELAEKRSELNRYVEALHHKRAAGCSVWDGLNRIWALEGVPLVSLAMQETASVTEEALVGWRSALHELRRSWELVGDPVTHPFSDCWFEDGSRSRENEAETALRDLDSVLGRLEDILGRVSVPFGLRSREMDAASVAALSGFLDWLNRQTGAIPSSLLQPGASERAVLIAEVVLEHAQASAASGECWYESGDAARHAEWARRLREVDAANPVTRFFGNRKLVKELRGRIRFVGKLDRGRIEEAVVAAQRKEEAGQRFVSVEADGRELFGHAWGDPAEVAELASRAAGGGAVVG